MNNIIEYCFRNLAAVSGWIKTVLATEQKKTDYNPQVTIFFLPFIKYYAPV